MENAHTEEQYIRDKPPFQRPRIDAISKQFLGFKNFPSEHLMKTQSTIRSTSFGKPVLDSQKKIVLSTTEFETVGAE